MIRPAPEYDYGPHARRIARDYAAATCSGADPSRTSAHERAGWALLAADSVARAAAIRSGATFAVYGSPRRHSVRVVETADSEPYRDADEMRADMRAGRFVVSRANCDHPLWTVAENVAFRVVHDCIGHGTSGGGFDWAGEVAACSVHFPLLAAPLARAALFTECIAQTAHACELGYFAAQVCRFLPRPELG